MERVKCPIWPACGEWGTQPPPDAPAGKNHWEIYHFLCPACQASRLAKFAEVGEFPESLDDGGGYASCAEMDADHERCGYSPDCTESCTWNGAS